MTWQISGLCPYERVRRRENIVGMTEYVPYCSASAPGEMQECGRFRCRVIR